MHFSRVGGLFAVVLGGAVAAPTTFTSHYAVKERHAVPRGWTTAGPAPAGHVLNLQIGLRQSNQGVLQQHVLEVSDPSHKRYGQHLSADEVHALVSPSSETVRLVQDWLQAHAISEHTLSPCKSWISVSVAVEKAESLLNTTYSLFRHTDGSALVRAPEWSLPMHLHEHVDLVQPTTSFFRPSKQASDIMPPERGGPGHSMEWWHQHKPLPPPPPAPGAPVNISAICNITYTTLECLRTLYGTINYVPQVPQLNSIAVTNYLNETQNRSDISIFLQNFRPEAAAVAYEFPMTIIANGSDVQTPNLPGNTGDIEGNLDGELVLGFTYPINFSAYNTGGMPPFNPDLNTPTDTNEPYLTWLSYVLAQKTLPYVISTSYGDDEQTVPLSYATSACNGFMQLAARGISVLFSSGDAGVGANGTCFSNTDPSKAMFIPAFPASCPWVTTVGGTAGFQPEVAVSRFGSGGGFSNYFGRPAYQSAVVEGYFGKIGSLFTGLYNTSGRGYPDVAAQGGSNHDVIVWNGTIRTVGGTSASSPTFAAVIALVNDALIAKGRSPLGFLNPWLYGGAYSALTDITSDGARIVRYGHTDDENRIGSAIGCNTSGFPAEVGWDAVTGFGTPNFGKLVDAAFDINASRWW
ncbi:hypothetical protein BAUCODRAFT_22902 [Baudoinia panamericana UAMH 10762]|uniref:tripeptidyl-peptidase II n=1 Tax=Baudoinia panamericana (strain UAMH 10762) TaxID=717646 RepID=M2N2B8_BAUPA|nr:uncharacterized protein BAUCODRAFT_22902 [Baudoinia panamericana UAMH 10762]EMC98058.1 hypothetical protein BAUCODRAFT_22902 [Baudoinia panamericana UAMH 10762]